MEPASQLCSKCKLHCYKSLEATIQEDMGGKPIEMRRLFGVRLQRVEDTTMAWLSDFRQNPSPHPLGDGGCEATKLRPARA